jgi:CubicO group peptidase (beta-lactamase class C family)
MCFEPGDKTLYSDLGFMLLEWVIEEVSGSRLDRFVGQAVYEPLGIRDLFYIDLHREKQYEGEFAATQLCPWRGRLLTGQVDDDNAWAMGGISGHAGLFGTALAVGILLNRLLMTGGGDRYTDFFQPRIISRFLQRQSSDGRALGFDVPTRPGSSSGRFFTDNSVGHLGFTGTSFWADLERSLVVILLTNRVHPFRFAGGIETFRPVLHDTVVQELGLV